jgi:hypothetical protein
MKKFVLLITGLIIGLSGIASAERDRVGEFVYFTQGKNISNFNTQLPAQKGALEIWEKGAKSTGNYLSIRTAPPRSHLKINVDVNMGRDVLALSYWTNQDEEKLSNRIPISQQLFHEAIARTHAYLVLPKEITIKGEAQAIRVVDNITEEYMFLDACSPENTRLSELLKKYNASIEGTYNLTDDEQTQLARAFDNTTGFLGEYGQVASLLKSGVKGIMDDQEREMVEKLQGKYGDGYVVYRLPKYVPEGISMSYSHIGREHYLALDIPEMEKNSKIFVEIPKLTFEVNTAGMTRQASLEGLIYEIEIEAIESIHNVVLPESLKLNNAQFFSLINIESIKSRQLIEMLPAGNSFTRGRNEAIIMENIIRDLQNAGVSFIYMVANLDDYYIGIKVKESYSFNNLFEIFYDLLPKCGNCEHGGYLSEGNWFIPVPIPVVDNGSDDWQSKLILSAPKNSQFVSGGRVTAKTLSEIEKFKAEEFVPGQMNSIGEHLPLISGINNFSVGQWGLVFGTFGLDGSTNFSIGTNDVDLAKSLKALYVESINKFLGYLDGLDGFSNVKKDILDAIGLINIERQGDRLLLQISNEMVVSFLSNLAMKKDYSEFEKFGESLGGWVLEQPEETEIVQPRKIEKAEVIRKSIKGKFLTHPKHGTVFVITGEIQNKYGVPLQMPEVYCELIGNSSVKKKAYVGCVASYDEILSYSESEMSDRLKSCDESQQNMAANGKLPFVSIFFELPEKLRNFGIELK